MDKRMKIMIGGAAALLLIIFCVLLFLNLLASDDDARQINAGAIVSTSSADTRAIVDLALEVAGTIKQGDYSSLAAHVHPQYGVYFCPTATVSLSSNKCFTAEEVAQFRGSRTSYVWGVKSDLGSPIDMTPDAYFIQYVFNTDYTKPALIGVDRVVKSGNDLDNVADAFPDARFVDLYREGTKENNYADWSILRLVFEESDGRYMLTAVIHSEASL